MHSKLLSPSVSFFLVGCFILFFWKRKTASQHATLKMRNVILIQMIYLTVSSPGVSYILYIVHIHFQLLYPKAMPLNSTISFSVCHTVYLSLYLIRSALHWTNRCGFYDLSAI